MTTCREACFEMATMMMTMTMMMKLMMMIMVMVVLNVRNMMSGTNYLTVPPDVSDDLLNRSPLMGRTTNCTVPLCWVGRLTKPSFLDGDDNDGADDGDVTAFLRFFDP